MARFSAFVFPGQGSQFRGMGRTTFHDFVELESRASSLLGYSVKELCLIDEDRRLADTRFTQPALYVVNVLAYEKALRDGVRRPDFFAGHSLGEYCALYAAGAFDFETGLLLVQQRGALMSEAVGGGMAAVLNLPVSKLLELIEAYGRKGVQIANLNSPSQVVLSGSLDALRALQPAVEQASGTWLPLKVSAAFHSPFMRATMERFAEILERFDMNDRDLPVISNVRARPYRAGELRTNLLEQICQPVRWTESVEYLLQRSEDDIAFTELGPKDTLSKLIAEIRSSRQPDALA